MEFMKKCGCYIGIAKNGRAVCFNSKAEMISCGKQLEIMLRLVGRKREAEQCAESLKRCIRRNARFGFVASKSRPRTKKTVRITIDPDVEYVGIKKALA